MQHSSVRRIAVYIIVPLLVALAGLMVWRVSYGAARVKDNPIYHSAAAGPWQPCEGLPGCEFIPSRGDPARGASEAVFRLAPGVAFAKHWHTSPEHVVGISGKISWNLENGEMHTVSAGDYLYYPSKMVHWGSCASSEPCVYYVYDDQPYDIHAAE
jgi:quercetin dioxygenase-like cupin family protein